LPDTLPKVKTCEGRLYPPLFSYACFGMAAPNVLLSPLHIVSPVTTPTGGTRLLQALVSVSS